MAVHNSTPRAANDGDSSARATTGMDSVRFDHAQGGAIGLHGSTGLSVLLSLGAVAKTRRFTESGPAYATDAQGREILAKGLGCALDDAQGGLAVVGKLVALASPNELDEGDALRVGWLVCGLAELAIDLRHELAEAEFTRSREA